MKKSEILEERKLFYRYFYKIENSKNVELAFECFSQFLNFKDYDLNENLFKKFVRESCDLYREVAYHNSDHALNTLNSGVYLLKSLKKYYNNNVNLEILFLLACYLHDIDHPGSKEFKNDSLEIEEHHIRVIKTQMNKFKDLFYDKKLRICDEIGLLSDLIYSTNLVNHQKILNEFTEKYFLDEKMEILKQKPEIGPLELKMLIKIADISASYKSFESYRLNSIILHKEVKGKSFNINQIDNKMEANFLKNVALPLIKIFCRVFKGQDFMIENCEANIKELERIDSK
ncbi:High affinity cAMP-specific and IBMX-insensitive 3',5'-cyclic phosphodiesterase 8A [Nosema bombycis CQ1]|uniref:High affinity cAMP-specific and IBMX-insensitive 3',5'-cyclic phosphodiesterase 8A n=1 Tax=Nosema bombycis (strain CQ1 / CVCC 102059) TaxID=578461 RepID=R0MGU3_NOSB1|nr:High affinity cAMP-specific and IBMX-insensitive 3',5'-cyclic phosphodiesterase 8A [Nosema bombycis CQ1]|eukprot:EOB11988.1 High affinity cAMP-specific and IBMX-insensitive 3',5'-cyclic phosphodiesterase 8A [Nosema bombycis CQ1]